MAKLKLLKRIAESIEMECTGSPLAFSKKLGISESTLYYYLGILKKNGVPVKYSATRQTYYFTKKGMFRLVYFEPL